MGVIRVERNANYTTMSNFHLQDKNLSLKAKGLISFCLSLPDDWDYSVAGLVKFCKEGRDCVMSTLAEMETMGYLHRIRLRNADGTLGATDYVIYERPQRKAADKPAPMSDNPTLVLPMLEKSALEKPTQQNTNLQNTKETNNEGKKERHRYGQYQNVLLTDEEHEKLLAEFPSDYDLRIDRLSEYMASTGKSYKNHLITIRSWARRESPGKQSYNRDAYHFEEGDSL